MKRPSPVCNPVSVKNIKSSLAEIIKSFSVKVVFEMDLTLRSRPNVSDGVHKAVLPLFV